jgi:hypothetical protein
MDFPIVANKSTRIRELNDRARQAPAKWAPHRASGYIAPNARLKPASSSSHRAIASDMDG